MSEIGALKLHKTTHQDGGADEIVATGLVGRSLLVDRGNLTAWDFVLSAATLDGASHDLDLSSIIPAGATFVLLILAVRPILVGNYFYIKNKGFANSVNALYIYGQVANVYIGAMAIISLPADRVLEYLAQASSFDAAIIAVSGWFI